MGQESEDVMKNTGYCSRPSVNVVVWFASLVGEGINAGRCICGTWGENLQRESKAGEECLNVPWIPSWDPPGVGKK